jgi:hypothetical protein
MKSDPSKGKGVVDADKWSKVNCTSWQSP